MKVSVLLGAVLLPTCACSAATAPSPPRMVVVTRDLRLETAAGRAILVQRVERATRAFCRAYDPMDPETRFDARLASTRFCPGAAAILLAQHMPMAVRRAYRAGLRERSGAPSTGA